MLTLFGEELIPEQIQAVPKVAGKKAEAAPNAAAGDSKSQAAYKDAVILADWAPDKQYYTIGEVAQLFDVRTSHIRYWTTEFALKVRTTRKGDRLYTPANIAELRAIYHLIKERGFTIPGAKAKLKEDQKTSVETLDLRHALLRLRNQLLTIRNGLLKP
jgi:DNA-binding transcriptional MerR regulator